MKTNGATTSPLGQEIQTEVSRQFAFLQQPPIEIRNEQWVTKRIAYNG